MDTLLLILFSLGIVCAAVLSMMLVKIVMHVAWAFAAACSVTRWGWACGKRHGFRPTRFPRWTYIPYLVLAETFTMLGSSPGMIECSSKNGVWKGIGNWTVFQKETDQC